ncbi:MAG TPA: hypothetical protein VMA95_08120 [Streptosporangiaceae bacterium]|nr:hypothetical protein [Streptosporangiaceae bacterium]
MLKRLLNLAAAAHRHLAAFAAVVALVVGSASVYAPTAEATGPPSPSTSGSAQAGGSIDAISCTSAGYCTAVGHRPPLGRKAFFAVSETHGTWGSAEAVPGVAALLGSDASQAEFTVLSCSSAGNCGAGGYYISGPTGKVITQAFVVSERNGSWGKPEQVSGLDVLDTGHYAMTQSISCTAPGDCSAGGFYVTTHYVAGRGDVGGFVVSEKNGTWGRATKITAVADNLSHLTCVSPGNCVGVGDYGSGGGAYPFAVTQRNGRWARARTFPRLVALASRSGKYADFSSISCATLGNCTTVGFYYTRGQNDTVFALSERNGVWGHVVPIPGMAELAPEITDGDITIGSLSCPSQGNCTTGGDFTNLDNIDEGQPYLVTEKKGIWQNARSIPGVAALSAASQAADFAGVACGSAGNCSAAGEYSPDPGGGGEVYVSTEKNGVWGKATELPGLAALKGSTTGIEPVLSCGAPGNCGLGGDYFGYPATWPYLATQRKGIWGRVQRVNGVSP